MGGYLLNPIVTLSAEHGDLAPAKRFVDNALRGTEGLAYSVRMMLTRLAGHLGERGTWTPETEAQINEWIEALAERQFAIRCNTTGER